MSPRDNYIAEYSLDARWFLELKSISRPLLLKSLEISKTSLQAEKAKVLADKSYNPIFEYCNLDKGSILLAQEKLLKLRETVCQTEVNSSIRIIYTEKLNELLLEQQILLAAAEGRHEEFVILNKSRFGDLDIKYIASGLRFLQSEYGFFADQVFEPVKNTREQGILKETIQTIFSAWPSIPPAVGLLTAEELKGLWLPALKKVGQSWDIEIVDNLFHMKVNSRRSKVYIPSSLKIKGEKVAGLFAHEIGTHVYRREQGKKHKIQLFSIGLSGNDVIEEGIALVRENAARNIYYAGDGFDKYLALSYAVGLIDKTPKDFNQTFSFMREYYQQRHGKVHTVNVAQQIATDRAWNSTVRIFRGGNTSIKGNCFYRDKIYREGLIKILDVLDTNPSYMEGASLGKFDITNQLQRDLARGEIAHSQTNIV